MVLELPQGKYEDITSLPDYPIMTSSGQQVALRDIAEAEYVAMLPSILRQDGKYVTNVTATTTDSSKHTAADAIDAAVAEPDLPEGAAIANGLMDDTTDEEVGHIVNALLIGIFLVFLVMLLMPAFYLLIRRENLDGTKKRRRKKAEIPSQAKA